MKNAPRAVVAVLAVVPAAWSQTRVDLFPVADATLYDSPTGLIANGSGEHAFMGANLRFEQIRRAVLRFDVAGALPAGARVVSADLKLFVSRAQAVDTTYSAHRVLTAWSEGPSNPPEPEGQGVTRQTGDCTWIHARFPDRLWAAPGGDFDPTPAATVRVYLPDQYTMASTPGLVGMVQGWLADPAGNFGLLLKGDDESLEGSAKRIGSRTNPNVSWRPVLVVVYTACGADFNGDGFVDFFDLEAFVGCFEGDGCPDGRDADYNDDGFVDFFDFAAYVDAFEAGC